MNINYFLNIILLEDKITSLRIQLKLKSINTYDQILDKSVKKIVRKTSLDKDFKNNLINEGINLSNADERDLLFYRVKWRAPAELNNILDVYHQPTLFTPDLPERSHIELKWEIPGNNETLSYQKYKQEVLNINLSPIKDMNKTGFRRISIFNLSDCMWSLFDSLKRLLKAFLIKKLYNKELRKF